MYTKFSYAPNLHDLVKYCVKFPLYSTCIGWPTLSLDTHLYFTLADN